MRQIREILRYHFEKKLSQDQIAGALAVSKGTVNNTLSRFQEAGFVWPLPEGMSDSDLQGHLYRIKSAPQTPEYPLPDMQYIEAELHRKHVTLKLLWREYAQQYPEGMSRPSFYRYVGSHLPKPVDMKMIHKGGDKLFVDFSGDGVEYIDRSMGEIKEAPLFVGSWGASSYTYAEACESEEDLDFVMAHEHGFRDFGCLPHCLTPDNTKSAIEKPDRYEAKANALYGKLAEHYNLAILPARIKKYKDKAVVESNVGFAQRYILGGLRNRQFFSVYEINVAIRELLIQLNNEPMQAYGGQSRKERFLALDKPYAQPLPTEPFRIRACRPDATVAPNYHVRFKDHFYSVPHILARQKVDIYLDGNIVEIYHNGLSVARHKKQPPNFGYSTIAEHMPPNHRFVKGWSKEWFLQKAGQIGNHTAQAVEIIMDRQKHPQQGFNSAMGVLNLARKFSPQRLEAAAERAIHYRGVSYRTLRTILEQKLDEQPIRREEEKIPSETVEHENVRGPDYYASLRQDFDTQAQTSLFEEVSEHGLA